MAKLERITQKIFGQNAATDDIAALGSFKTGTPIYTDNLTTLQNSNFETGFASALVADEAPFMEEQNSIPYVITKQLAYLFQEGIPEYDPNTTYYTGSIVKQVSTNDVILYLSRIDANTNNPLDDYTKWQPVNLTSNDNVILPLGLYIRLKGAQPSSEFLIATSLWNSGTIYKKFYSYYADKIGQAFCAGYVRAHTDEYTDYDLVINSEDVTFKLPLLDGSENLPDYSVRVQESINIVYYNETNAYIYVQAPYDSNEHPTLSISTNANMSENIPLWSNTLGLNTPTTDAGTVFIPKGFYYRFGAPVNPASQIYRFPCKGNGDLYFYVGESAKNGNQINAVEKLTTHSMIAPKPVIDKVMYKNKFGNFSFAKLSDEYVELTEAEQEWFALHGVEGFKIVDNDFIINPDFEAEQAQKERERINMLSLSKREVFLTLYKAKGITPDELKAQISDPVALIEFEYANDYYRGNPLIGQIGAQLGFTNEELDYLFINKELPVKEESEVNND